MAFDLDDEELKATRSMKGLEFYDLKNKMKDMSLNNLLEIVHDIKTSSYNNFTIDRDFFLAAMDVFMKEYNELKQLKYSDLQKEDKEKGNITPVLIDDKMYFIEEELYRDLSKDIRKNYVSVLKIRDKIKELETIGTITTIFENGEDKNDKKYIMEDEISVLKELIGE